MKKIFLYTMLIFMALSMPVYAEFKNPSIIDNAGYLTQSELSELSARLDALREKYNYDVAIYTQTDMSGYDAMETADDIYDYNGYGAGETADGIMLYICKSRRQYHFTTCGKGMWAFTDNGLIYLEKKVVPYLSDNDCYGAFCEYIKQTDMLLGMAQKGKPFDRKQYGGMELVAIIAICIFAPLLIAFIMMKMKLAKMKTARENNYALNYMKNKKITTSGDMFLFSNITKTRREKSSSGSGSHTSSSGTSHGGRGGSF